MGWDEIKWISGVIVVIALCIGCLVWGGYQMSVVTCDQQTSEIGVPHRFTFWGGCQVQEKGNWIPLDNWRYFGD
jgi:hypothetical protein